MGDNRSQNIKVRITDQERATLEKAMRAAGYTNLSDYIRHKLDLHKSAA